MAASTLTLSLHPLAPAQGLTLRWPRNELSLDPARPVPLEILRPADASGNDRITLLVEGGTIAPTPDLGADWQTWQKSVEGHSLVRLEGTAPGQQLVFRVLPDPNERVCQVQAQWGHHGGEVALNLTPSTKQWFREALESVVYAFFIAIVIRTFLFQAFYIPSASMQPTLDIRDRLVANKFLYRFREPARQEVIIFRVFQRRGSMDPELSPPPAALERNYDVKDYIKRVIGLPGDTVEIRDGQVLVNSAPLEEPYLTDDRRLNMLDWGPYEVPEGKYFCMGDNRPNSKDSRFIGSVPEENIIGKAHFVFWPLHHVRWLR